MPKGKKKGKKGKEEAPPPEPSEFDGLTTDALKVQIAEMKPRLERAQLDRNQVQLDRDTLQTFYDISSREVGDLELKLLAKDREMEVLEDNHRVEVRVYVQKVKHLEYEHTHAVARIESDNKGLLAEEGVVHSTKEGGLRRDKASLKLEMREREHLYAMEVQELKSLQEKNLTKLRDEFAESLTTLGVRYEKRLEKLRAELELRLKVEMHEIEERKHLHIGDLVRSHDASFGEIKRYYNEITKDNLKLVRLLKAQIAELHRTQIKNQKITSDITQDNRGLAEPLKVAMTKLAVVKDDLKDADKDRMSLRNAKARLQALEREMTSLTEQQLVVEAKNEAMEAECATLAASFEATISAVHRRSDFRNVLLEKRLTDLAHDFDSRQAVLNEVLVAANLDPAALSMVAQRLDQLLDDRNRMVRELQYNVARVTKAHNDALRVYEQKLTALGVAVEEVGFAPLSTATGLGPAGLVAAPTV